MLSIRFWGIKFKLKIVMLVTLLVYSSYTSGRKEVYFPGIVVMVDLVPGVYVLPVVVMFLSRSGWSSTKLATLQISIFFWGIIH